MSGNLAMVLKQCELSSQSRTNVKGQIPFASNCYTTFDITYIIHTLICNRPPKYDIIFSILLQSPILENGDFLCNRLKIQCKRLRDFFKSSSIFF